MTASLLLALRRRLWLLLIVPVLVGTVVFLTTPTPEEVPNFVTTALIAANPSTDFGPQRVRQDALIIREATVINRAIEVTGSDETLDEFRARVSVESDVESYVISVFVNGDTPDGVQADAEAIGDSFIRVVQARANETLVAETLRRQAAFDQASAEYDLYVAQNAAGLNPASPDPAVVDRRNELFDIRRGTEDALEEITVEGERLASVYEVISVSRGARPQASTFALMAEPPVRAIAAGIITLIGLVAAIAILDRLRPRVTDRLQVEKAIDAPVLTMVPRVRRRTRDRRITRSNFQGPGAEAHRTLRVHLQFLANKADGDDVEHAAAETGRQPIVAVVSPAPGDGKTTTAAMLALAFAQADAETLVLGCDFRRPAIHDSFGMPSTPGLTDRRRLDPLPDLGALIRTDSETGVRVLPSGRPTSHAHDALMDTPTVIKAAGSTGHVVIFDTAPILVASETSQLAALADFVVMVVHAGKTSMRALSEAATTLRLNSIDITGVVMIGSPEASDYSYYYGEYGRVPDEVEM